MFHHLKILEEKLPLPLFMNNTRFCQITLIGIKKFIKISLKAKMLVTQSCPTLHPHGRWPARLLCSWNSPGKNTRVGCHALLQGLFPIQGLNLGLLHLLHWQEGSLPLAPPGNPCNALYYLIRFPSIFSFKLHNHFRGREY